MRVLVSREGVIEGQTDAYRRAAAPCRPARFLCVEGYRRRKTNW